MTEQIPCTRCGRVFDISYCSEDTSELCEECRGEELEPLEFYV